MLTPQDIQSKEFTKAVFGGYDMSAVNEFLDDLTDDYSSLYKENAILKSKIKVLVEKVEEYRSTEDAMRMALLTAQKMGDDLLAEAKTKSQDLLSKADEDSNTKRQNAAKEIAAEEARLKLATDKTSLFVSASKKLIEQQIKYLDNLYTLSVEAAPDKTVTAKESVPAAVGKDAAVAAQDDILDTAKQIDAYVSKILKNDPIPEAEETGDDISETKVFRSKNADADWDDDDELTSPRPKFDFDNLQFGTNYFDDK